MQYVIKYKLFFHTFNKEIEDTIKVETGFLALMEKETVVFITKLMQQSMINPHINLKN